MTQRIGNLVEDLEKWDNDPSLLMRIHEAIGWKREEYMEECGPATPGGQFNVGLDCWEIPSVRWYPPDLEARYKQMHIDEGEDPPSEYDESAARDWWAGDDHEEQYPQDYIYDPRIAMSILPPKLRFYCVRGACNYLGSHRGVEHEDWEEDLARAICIVYLRTLIPLKEREEFQNAW